MQFKTGDTDDEEKKISFSFPHILSTETDKILCSYYWLFYIISSLNLETKI